MSDPNRPENEGNEPSTPNEKKNEIRYVPVEYIQGPGYGFPEDEDEIDLMELAKKIWAGRWTIVKITGVFIVLGVFWALFSAEEFESDAVLMPEVQAEQGAGGASQLLQRFGGASGISAGGSMPAGTIPPMVYPQIVNSLSFQLELMSTEIEFREYGVTTTWPDFLENHYSKPITAYIKKYTVGLPFTVLGGIRELFTTEEEGEQLVREDVLEQEFISLSREEFELVKQMRERISVSQDQETGLLTTKVKLQDARAAAEMNRHLIDLLKRYVTDYRVEKARQNLEFSENQKQEAEERFREAQQALAEFQDRNVALSSARAQTELERLQDEKNLALNVYQSLAQRVEEARLNLQEQTPIFSEVQPANVPTERSEPKRGLMVIVFTLLGGILSVGWVLIAPLIGTFRENLMEG
ncbi:Wzz/FepE/Etk N-terminal domain-containing protein [Rhodohalobacter halophilus]|uniref:Wzz/FepE/Etk N-terminal domain-containing protein n=1 Tax=Rhodohalobacter halophilus TaxID=1812810 RepID=UPI00083FD1C8|nr:Wzz/FepE/Etk N-terminal domain-containing protein [Rhodohalobacter halophilus]